MQLMGVYRRFFITVTNTFPSPVVGDDAGANVVVIGAIKADVVIVCP